MAITGRRHRITRTHQQFANGTFDIANVNGTLLVENPAAGEVRLVLPFPVEQASAQARVLSTGVVETFRKRDGRGEQFVEFLRTIGEIPADQTPLLKEILPLIKEYYVADIEIPQGSQLLRFHARQKLNPIDGNPRSYQLELFAPLAGFILAAGQATMSVTVSFPPLFAAPGLTIGTPTITALPGQAAPPEQPSGPFSVAERAVYGWLWRQDPKLTFPYSYS